MTVFDLQVDGVQDDGTESGAIRAAITRGDLIQHPFVEGHYFLTAQAGGSGATFASGGHMDNQDGLGGLVRMAATIGLPTNLNSGVRLYVTFTGRVFGIRFRRNINTTTDGSFSVSVDGVAVEVQGRNKLLDDESEFLTDGDGIVITHTDLSEGQHEAWITLVGISANARGLELFGYLVEPRSGYKPYGRQQAFIGPFNTPFGATIAVAADIRLTTNQGTLDPRRFFGFSQIIYYNTTGAPITVQIVSNSGIIWGETIAAAGKAIFNAGAPTAPIQWVDTVGEKRLQHWATATGLNFTILGAF